MIVYILVEEFEDGGSLLLGADTDYETIKKLKGSFESNRIRIAQIEVTNKRMQIK